MTISEFTLKSSDLEPVRRSEVFTGTGRRREWVPEEKARIVAESYEADKYGMVLSRADTLVPVATVHLCVGPLASRRPREWRCRTRCSCQRLWRLRRSDRQRSGRQGNANGKLPETAG